MNYEPTNKHKPLVGHGLFSQLLISDLHVYLTTQSSTCQCTREPLAWCRLRGRLIWLLWGHAPETFPTRKKVIQSYYCWWFRNPKQPPGMYKNLQVLGYYIYQMSTGAGLLPSTVSLTYMSTSNYCWIFRDLARHCIFFTIKVRLFDREVCETNSINRYGTHVVFSHAWVHLLKFPPSTFAHIPQWQQRYSAITVHSWQTIIHASTLNGSHRIWSVITSWGLKFQWLASLIRKPQKRFQKEGKTWGPEINI